MQAVVAFLIGSMVGEITFYYHWFDAPGSPAATIISGGITLFILWLARRPLGRWIEG